MSKVLFLFVVFYCNTCWSNPVSKSELRVMYYKAVTDKEIADRFLQTMNGQPCESDPLLLAYKGVATMIEANHYFNPYRKLSYFSDGKALLEHAIEIDPENVEIRFLRFCVQTNAPFFLGYRNAINTDKTLILHCWKNIADIDLKYRIKDYFLSSGYCTKTEQSILL